MIFKMTGPKKSGKEQVEMVMEDRIKQYTQESESALWEIERSIQKARQNLSQFRDEMETVRGQSNRAKEQIAEIITLARENRKRIAGLAHQSLEDLSNALALKEKARSLIGQEYQEAVRGLRSYADKYGMSFEWESEEITPEWEERIERLKKTMTAVVALMEDQSDEPDQEMDLEQPGSVDEMPEEREISPESTGAEGSTILVVEDDPVSARILQYVLAARKGYEVEIVSDAEAALIGLERKPSLILLNVFFFGMDVETFMGRAVRGNPPIPVLAIGSYGEQAALRRIVERGASDFLTKPISLDDLMNKVDAALAAGGENSHQSIC